MVKADKPPPPQVEEVVVELEEGSTTTPLSPDIPILALVQCVLNGGSSEATGGCLTAVDICHIGMINTIALRCSNATPGYWACIDLSLLPRPIRFFEHGGTVSLRERFKVTTTLIIQFCNDLLDEHLFYLPPSLTSLTLDACHNITDQGIKTAAQHCGKRLELLSIYWNTQIGDPSCLALSIRCPSLTSISFSGCKQVGASGILALSSRCKKLQHLNLTRCRGVDDIALSAITQSNTSLRELRLYACTQYTDAPIITAASHCPHLHTLDCTGLAELTDASLIALSKGCTQLSTLILSWVVELTDTGVCALVHAGCPLHTLSLHGIKGVGEPSLNALAKHCSTTLVSLDVRGCVNLETSSREALARLFPRVTNFVIAT